MADASCPPDDPYCIDLTGAANAVINSQPKEDQGSLRRIYVNLIKLPTNDLYQLKAMDSCGQQKTIDCGGLSYSKIKEMISLAIDQRKAAESAEDARISRYISIGGAAISFCSLIISIVSIMRKRSGPSLET
jgi:hypothetical protein